MGYTTEFEGHFVISPPLSDERVEELNSFCLERHGGACTPHEGMPSLWCDWAFTKDKMFWNGSEKSYEMVKWANFLNGHFLDGHSLSGEIQARGEESNDIWTMVADGGSVKIRNEWK